ncbi:hypothetical protein ABZU32_37740 [Sphaerisporangium sp. NPDC005288]|uniref:hypothetical protein n=1 Tax=Sphaerisporangium sp. NPDC005288 TaxID=3155114 RepID=UPI0033B9FD9B
MRDAFFVTDVRHRVSAVLAILNEASHLANVRAAGPLRFPAMSRAQGDPADATRTTVATAQVTLSTLCAALDSLPSTSPMALLDLSGGG